MPRKKRAKPLYQRGPFALHPRRGRNHEIIWYDTTRKRERSVSAGTSDDEQARAALDRHYLESTGQRFCPTCGREFDGDHAPRLSSAIIDYLILREGTPGHRASKNRLGHVVDYIAATDPETTVPAVTQEWVERFRKWLLSKPVISPKGKVLRARSLGHVEGCVLQLAAVINSLPGHKAAFTADALKEVSKTPRYRADVETIAAMFRFCIDPPAPQGRAWSEKERAMVIGTRVNLLRFLRASVATWARPEALFDLTYRQWHREAGVLDLNPPSRRQTKKFRPAIPVARQFRPWLDELASRKLYIENNTIRHAWDRMREHLDLPPGGEAGPKLIRRSMATLTRRRIGEENWVQGEMMLGHRKASTSDIYALPDPANLGKALAATEAIIDEIEALCPGAYRTFTALKCVAK